MSFRMLEWPMTTFSSSCPQPTWQAKTNNTVKIRAKSLRSDFIFTQVADELRCRILCSHCPTVKDLARPIFNPEKT